MTICVFTAIRQVINDMQEINDTKLCHPGRQLWNQSGECGSNRYSYQSYCSWRCTRNCNEWCSAGWRAGFSLRCISFLPGMNAKFTSVAVFFISMHWEMFRFCWAWNLKAWMRLLESISANGAILRSLENWDGRREYGEVWMQFGCTTRS